MLTHIFRTIRIFSLVTYLQLFGSLAWDPDAGLVRSWTKFPNVTATSTSNQKDVYQVNDGNDDTHWTSASCLPTGYLEREGLNVLLGSCQSNCRVNNDVTDANSMTDGNFYTTFHVPVSPNNGKALVEIDLGSNSSDILKRLSIWGIYDGTVEVKVQTNSQVLSLKNVSSDQNYGEVRMTNLPMTAISKVILESSHKFIVKELSALGNSSCIEIIVLDLGDQRRVSKIRTRHWSGRISPKVTLLLSDDSENWVKGSNLNSSALHEVYTRIASPGLYRYIAIEYDVPLTDYAKVYCWEIDAYDENGQWGPPTNPKPHPLTLREMLGVNGIWGWGHSTYSNQLSPGQGPTLFNQMSSHARNYHNLDWDVLDPDNDPEFEQMGQGQGTNAKWWLNWDTEYTAWRAANLTVDASIQFTTKSFPQSTWDDVTFSGHRYGREFARHFGPQNGNGLVQAMEIGNEPWGFPATFYASVLESMSAGARSVDGSISVLPCALQAHEISPSEPQSGNYIGNRVLEHVAENISALNIHAYSFTPNAFGVRIATYPENIDSDFNSLRNMLRWRDVNTPSKPVWLTEWGWDADGKGENCRNTECVSELAQAVYGVRAFLISARLGIEKVTWYFYANTPGCETLFCRSGLTTSVNHGFTKKAVFHALQGVLEKIGNRKFIDVLQENMETGYVYVFGENSDMLTHLVAWLPDDIIEVGKTKSINIQLPCNYAFGKVWQVTGSSPPIQEVHGHVCPSNLELSVKPLIIELKRMEAPVIG